VFGGMGTSAGRRGRLEKKKWTNRDPTATKKETGGEEGSRRHKFAANPLPLKKGKNGPLPENRLIKRGCGVR